MATVNINQIQNILKKNYPKGKIPIKLVHILEHEIEKDLTLTQKEQVKSSEKSKKHLTKKMMHFVGVEIKIDRSIAKLIKYLWMCKINTLRTSENDIPKDYIWIRFSSTFDIENFLKILFDQSLNNDPDFVRAILDCYYQKNAWIYDTDIWTNNNENITDILVSISLRFPKSDYQWIRDKFKKYLIENKKL